MTFTSKTTDAAGQPVLAQFTATLDGKETPMTGDPRFDTISVKRIDRFTSESIQKKGGKVVARNRRVISPDGKLMTLTSELVGGGGSGSKDVLVFDKQ